MDEDTLVKLSECVEKVMNLVDQQIDTLRQKVRDVDPDVDYEGWTRGALVGFLLENADWEENA